MDELRSRIEVLEERQNIRRGYYFDTLAWERTAYAALLTVIGALFVFFSYGVVRWRINRTEADVQEALDSQKEELKRDIESANDNLDKEVSAEIDHLRDSTFSTIGELEAEISFLEERIQEDLEMLYREAKDFYEGSEGRGLAKYLMYETRRLVFKKETEVEIDTDSFYNFLDEADGGVLSELKSTIENAQNEIPLSFEEWKLVESNLERLSGLCEDREDKVRIENITEEIDNARG